MEQNKQSAPQNAASEAAVRRQKLADLKAAGHDPFTITKCKQDAFSADLKEEYKDLPAEEDTGRMVSLAGRMMSKRVMGIERTGRSADFKRGQDGGIDLQKALFVQVSADLFQDLAALDKSILDFGVDDQVMLLTDSASIRDVLLFPTMKPID